MTQKDIYERRINSRLFFFVFCISLFSAIASLPFFWSTGIFIPVLFLVVILLVFSTKKTLYYIIGAACAGILTSIFLYYYGLSVQNNIYYRLPDSLEKTRCSVTEKKSESFFYCTLENAPISLSIPAGNTIKVGDTLSLVGQKIEQPESERQKTSALGIYANYTIESFEITPRLVVPLHEKIIHWAKKQIESLFPPREAALFEGMLLGISESFDGSQKDAYKSSGLSHLVVASGSNIILVLGFFLALTRALPPKIRSYFLLLVVWWYTLLAGAETPLLRAACMSSIALFCIGKPLRSLPILFVTALFFCLYNPFILAYSASFQLSFLATLSLILLGEPLSKLLRKIKLPNSVSEAIASSFAAIIFTLPVTVFSFGNFAPYSLFSNILAAPLVAPALLFGGIATFLESLSHTLATLFGIPAYICLAIINDISTITASLPFAYIKTDVSDYTPVYFALFFSIISLFILYKEITPLQVSKNELASPTPIE